MRISTQTMHMTALNAMLDQQAALSRTQNQVASGKKILSPADDPVATVRILEFQRAQAESDQFAKNSDVAKSRLTLEEQALGDSGNVLQRMRELVVQAGNTSVLTATDRQAIATEVQQRLQELTDIANRKDGNGDYMFSGYSTRLQPFARNSAGTIAYAGDQGNRLVQVGPTQQIADSHSGFDVFMNVPQGNGTFFTTANALNTGTGVMDVGSVINKAAWVPDNYTLSFTGPATWQIVNSASVVVAGGAYVSGSSIAFNGVQVSITGAPTTGDSFAISQSRTEDVFATLDRLVQVLQQPGNTAQLSTALGNMLQQLDQSGEHLMNVRTQVGARLSALDAADSSRQDLSTELQTFTSQLRDVDYATALTQMNQQQVGLQAAQQSYAKISQLLLFNYL